MRVAIIGGGFTGLSCAVALCQKGVSPVIFEAKNESGGLARGFSPGDWRWSLEIFYHHVFTNDKEILALAKLVDSKILVKQTVTTSYYHGKDMELDSPLSVIKFSGISLWARLQMGFGLLILKLIPNGLFLEKYKAVEILPKLLGKQGYEVIWEKLLKAKFGPYAPEVNLAWFWSRVAKRSKKLIYFGKGFTGLIEKTEEYIKAHGGEIRLGTKAEEITLMDSRLRGNDEVTRGDGERRKVWVDGEAFDAVVITTPAPVAKKLLPEINLPTINYLWGQTLILELSRKTIRGYWMNILEKEFPFLVAVEHTNMIDKKMYGKKRLLYLGNYLPADHKQLKMTQEQLINLYSPFIKRINSHFNKKQIKRAFLFREPYAQPVFPVNYSREIPGIRFSPGIYLANMSMVYPFDRGTNYAVKLGEDVAKLVMTDLK